MRDLLENLWQSAKNYLYRKVNKKPKNKHCKGTNECAVAKSLTFDDLKTCIFDGTTIERYNDRIIFLFFRSLVIRL